MKKIIAAIVVFVIMVSAVFATDLTDGFGATVGRAIAQIIPSSDTIVVVNSPVNADTGSDKTIFSTYLKRIIEEKTSSEGKEIFDLNANELSEDFLATLSDRGYAIDASSLAKRKVPDGEISCAYAERDNMVQISFVYKQYIGTSKRMSVAISTKDLPGLTFTPETTDAIVRHIKEEISVKDSESARSICLSILSLINRKESLTQRYNNSFVSMKNNIDSWYNVEYNRRVVGAEKEPWETEDEFKEALKVEQAVLAQERREKEAELLKNITLDVSNIELIEIQKELDAYYTVLNESLFSFRTIGTILDFDAETQSFPIQISVSTPKIAPQFEYSKLVKFCISKPNEILTREERRNRYNALAGSSISVEIKYCVLPDSDNPRLFVNVVKELNLFNPSDGSILYSEQMSEKANVFAPDATSSEIPTDVAVITVPSGATIYINDEVKGVSPIILTDLKEGKQIIKAVWKDGTVRTKNLDVIPGLISNVELYK